MTPATPQAPNSVQAPSGPLGGVATPKMGQCVYCGEPFQINPKAEKHEHCSDQCRMADWDKRHPRKKPRRKQRTTTQNKSLHKLFYLYCEALNDAGYSVMKTMRHDVEIPWNSELFKNLIWRPIQEAMTGKHSTTELNTVDPSEIHQVLDRHLAEKFGVSVPWPSEENR